MLTGDADSLALIYWLFALAKQTVDCIMVASVWRSAHPPLETEAIWWVVEAHQLALVVASTTNGLSPSQETSVLGMPLQLPPECCVEHNL